MPKFRIIPESETVNQLQFMCPGCKETHALNNTWQFNGNLDKPTVSPSVLVRWTMGPEKISHVCHSFITDGVIQFLGDCTHSLSGQKIELPEIE